MEVKVLVAEIDGQELEYGTELSLSKALNMIEFSGLPCEHILSSESFIIPSRRQMPIFGELVVEGEIDVQGALICLE